MFHGISQEEIKTIFDDISKKADVYFTYFFESYKRKVDKEYSQEFIENALRDVKMRYYIYRKLTNPQWDAASEQISISEMENLYNILTNTKHSQDVSSGEIPR